jgi:hypothetical protein
MLDVKRVRFWCVFLHQKSKIIPQPEIKKEKKQRPLGFFEILAFA